MSATKDKYIIEVIFNIIKNRVDDGARLKTSQVKKRSKIEGIVYMLRVKEGSLRRRFITVKRARQLFYELYIN